MIKKIVIGMCFIPALLTATSVFKAENFNDIKMLDANYKEGDFNSKSTFDIKSLLETNTNKVDLKRQLDMSSSMYTGDNFLTREEFSDLDTGISESVSNLQGPHKFILYFYSESVPKSTVKNMIEDISRLQKSGMKVMTKQYMFGLPADPQTYFNGWQDYLANQSFSTKKALDENFAYKTDSRFFKMYDIKAVPAIAIATCSSIIPDTDSCKVDYLMHGDAPLITFFAKIVRTDKSYLEYYNILNSLKYDEVKLK